MCVGCRLRSLDKICAPFTSKPPRCICKDGTGTGRSAGAINGIRPEPSLTLGSCCICVGPDCPRSRPLEGRIAAPCMNGRFGEPWRGIVARGERPVRASRRIWVVVCRSPRFRKRQTVGSQIPSTTTASSSPGHGGKVTATAASGSLPTDLNWNRTPSGIVTQAPASTSSTVSREPCFRQICPRPDTKNQISSIVRWVTAFDV